VDENAVMEAIRAVLSSPIEGTAGLNRQAVGQMGLSLLSILAVLWLIGFIAFMIYHMIAYQMTYRHLHRWSIAVYDQHLLESFDKIKTALSIQKNIKLYQNENIASPMLIGFSSPCILLPYTNGSTADYSDILLHELHHYKRRDLWYKLLMLFANGVQWFNPLAYLMLRQAEIDMELACDNDVLRDASPTARKKYGMTILSFIEQKQDIYSPLTTCFYGSQEQMKRRFSDISHASKKRSGKVFFVTIILAVVFCGAWAGNASTAIAAERVRRTEYIDADIIAQQQSGQAAELERVYSLIGSPESRYDGGRMTWPVPNFYDITSTFGLRYNGSDYHAGIDISGTDIDGAPVIAAEGGTVVFTNREDTPGVAYGIYMIIDHGGGISTVYSHLSEVTVNEGDAVEKGEQIANVGSTGYANGSQLQFEVRENGKAVDPITYLVSEE
jgi:beta-lactamase regulating signal transducer with metallopeptidase domain